MFRPALSLALTLFLIAPAVAADAKPGSTQSNQELKRYIIDGIHHFQTSLPDAAVQISYHGNDTNKLTNASENYQDAQKAMNDAPTTTIAQAFWIARNGNLSFDVLYQGNLNTDKADNTWYAVENRLVLSGGKVSTLNRYRKRVPKTEGGYDERYGWSGNLNQDVLEKTLWRQHYHLDPRYFAYFIDDQSLDQVIADKTFASRVSGIEKIYGAKCARIELKKTLPDGSVFTNDCWVDLDHSFILRRTRETVTKPHTAASVFYTSECPQLTHSGSVWLPASFIGNMFLPTKKANGESGQIVVTETATIGPIPPSYEWLDAPFDIRWPEGAFVEDIPNDKRYVAQKNGTLKIVTE